MKLDALINETDALTWANALKVTLLEMKDEVSSIKEMTTYIAHSSERIDKLMRKADNQYRMISKLVNREGPIVSNITVQEEIDEEQADELKEVMEQHDK